MRVSSTNSSVAASIARPGGRAERGHKARDRPPARHHAAAAADLVLDRPCMIGEQEIGAIDAVQLEQAPDEIGPAAQQQPG